MNTTDIMAGANVVLATVSGVFSLRWCLRHGFRKPFGWLKILFVLISFYWAGLYLFVLWVPLGIYEPVQFGHSFVRPAFLFTLAVMAASAIQRWRAGD